MTSPFIVMKSACRSGPSAAIPPTRGGAGGVYRVFYTLLAQQNGTLISDTGEVLPGDSAEKAARAIEIMTKWQSFALPFGHDLGVRRRGAVSLAENHRAILLGQQRDARTRGGAGGVYRVFYTLLAQQNGTLISDTGEVLPGDSAERPPAPSRS